jgi:two-component system, LytTR family, sensor kinase
VHGFHTLLNYVLVFCVSATLGFLLISKARKLFLFIRPELLRRNIVTFLIGLSFFFALGHLLPDFRNIMENFGWARGFLLSCAIIAADVLIPYNIVLYVTEGRRFASMGFMKQQIFIFCGIVVTSIVVNGFFNYWINNTTKFLKYSIVWSFYIAGFGSLIYLFMRQYDMEKKKKLAEKELELARARELKTKAELDALHSKVNPHFLYNALNSIADLSINDGRKARQMTIALADLFRRSINYNQSNFATVEEELETARLYLEIEKTRFEDRLVYTIEADESSLNLLVPKFILQPLIENAVKHGLKPASQIAQIRILISCGGEGLTMRVYDNGSAFPVQIDPGYGLKSVYDKLELLFPENFFVQLINRPEKHIAVTIKNPSNELQEHHN